jgi:uncharacterized protein (UPF0333 family)
MKNFIILALVVFLIIGAPSCISGCNNTTTETTNTSKVTTHVGPRGGHYYINSKGKKVYKKRK